MRARYGGDEFSVILIDTDLEAAMEIGERIRLAFHQHRNGNISLSMGWRFSDGDTPERLLKRADDAMYRAKRKGESHRVRIGMDLLPLRQNRLTIPLTAGPLYACALAL